jgi:fructose-1,6-bisphosphatase/inositol monophosphatase family enzyme
VNDISIIKKALSDKIQPCRDPGLASEWAQFGFYVGFQLFKMIRPWRLKIAALVKEDKSDGSPATDLEGKAEAFTKQALMTFYPEAGFQGEETGAENAHHLYQLIIDPIDGTRSFLSGFDTYSVTLGIIRARESVFSLIINPASGDFAYRIANEPSRIFQYPCFSEEISLIDLPYLSGQNDADAPVLVNIHPSKAAKPFQQELYNLWENREVALVKSVSGSPSLQILEVARGSSFYFNTWFEGETMPYDLIVPLDILRGAGGQILGKKGNPIDPWDHRGPFVAGMHQEKLEWLLRMLKVR